MNRTEFIGTNLYYSQDFLDDRYKEMRELQQENKQLKEKVKNADELCDRYMGVKLELFDMYELLNKIREILGGKDE